MDILAMKKMMINIEIYMSMFIKHESDNAKVYDTWGHNIHRAMFFFFKNKKRIK